MTSSQRLLLAAFASAAFVPCHAAQAERVSAQADKDIGVVVEAFRTAIIAKDRERFLKLFYPGATSWIGVYGDASLQQGLKKHPERAKAYAGSPAEFIEAVAGAAQRSEEEFSNVAISSDADVASVSFDYRFLKDGVATNHGRECWHLVRAADGWKINSVIYSVNF